MARMARASAQYSNIRVDRLWPGKFEAAQGKGVRKLTEAIAADCIAGCPIDSGDLVETIRPRFPGGLVGQVVVGGADAPYWSDVEYGSRPHIIRSHGRWSLRSDDGEYFGREVHHPGTPAQPFMRPALFRRRSVQGL